jgi:hypothetical protein
MNILEEIKDFGSIDAENDGRLIEYFFKTPVLDNLYEYKKSIVIGRKGTGKTAIYKYIIIDKKNCVSDLLFKDYPWKIHDRFKNNIVSERESFVYSWEFFFYIEIFKKLVFLQDKLSNGKTKKQIKKIKKWLSRNWGNEEFSHKETLNPRKGGFQFTISPSVYGFTLGSLSRTLHKNENPGYTLSEYNNKFEKILNRVLKNFSGEIILLFDELDLAYSSEDLNYKNRLIGLLLAAYSFFPKFDKKIKIYLFLRSDIFNLLDFQDKNKIKDNMVEFLDWESKSVDSRLSLKQIAANRIKVNIESSSDNFERNWHEIFDNSNIGRNQSKWNFIMDRSFIRPRDLIKFMNLSLEQAKNRLNLKPETIDKIKNEDIHAIRNDYSQYLYEELKDELTGKYDEFNFYLEILRDIHRTNFTFKDFEKSYNNIQQRKQLNAKINETLERLFEFSIIGFYKPGGGGFGGSEYSFQYTAECQPFNPKANRFKVHPGFKEYLELIE